MFDGRPVAHVAAEPGLSRQCGHRRVRRFRTNGWDGLRERRSGTPADTELRVLASRAELRAGPDQIARATGVLAWTVTRILRRHGVPALAACDPLTGAPIRATQHSTRRYEHSAPGDMIHLDVKKLGRIPDDGGWRAHGRSEQVRGRGIGYDYLHTAIDDHSRLAYAEVLTDEKGTTCAAFLTRRRRLVRRPRHHPHPPGTDRQRQELPHQPRLPAGLRRPGNPPEIHPTALPPGPTANPNASTAPWPPNGPTAGPTPATSNAPRPSTHG
ncbi:hypothetical protein HD597_000238 [Nonomuraea thailandensis]|uniref:Transposase n=1 Tax=Nonomuraea thailandensis TaxID=1188745 RepID=A0A9X2GFP3_9ACTN|nr:hypothetical protein [Nonomuraea thailandensis]